jgi:hypothetical protein
MIGHDEWTFTGASGKEYTFTLYPKSEGLPPSAGVFILAYTHLRGHMAGWQTNPLRIGQGENMSLALTTEMKQEADKSFIWNSNLVLLEPNASAREECVRDLNKRGPKYFEIKSG